MRVLSAGLVFCDVPLCPSPRNIMELDNYPINKVECHTGGDALTVGVVLSKMGVPVSLIGYIGEDGNGQFILRELEKQGIDVSMMKKTTEYSTATSYQLIEENGERHFLVDAKICDLIRDRDIPDEAIENCDLVFLGSALALAGMNDTEIEKLFTRAHKAGKLTAMDASVALKFEEKCKMDILRKALQHTDIFIPSYEEASYLAQKTDIDEILEAFRGFPFKVFGIKLGAEGCILTEDFQTFVRRKPFSDFKAIDTTGAGDCFMGGFISSYLKGWSLEACAEFATAVAGFGISAVGATTAVPDYSTVCRFIETHK